VPHVLVVDDDATQLFLRAAVLRTAGFSVLTAGSASEALSLLVNSLNDIGAIVTDHVLSGDGGTEFIREVRRTWQFLPVVVVSGLAEAEPEYAGLNVGFLRKPCPPAELIAALQASFSNSNDRSI
jgi:DNA-binding response OmpR family regulator